MNNPLLRRHVSIFLSLLLLTFVIGSCTDNEPPPKPTALFDYYPTRNLVAPVKLYFTNKSENATSYVWTYGSGQTTSAKDITLTINTGGAYTVTLEATGKGGTDTHTETIYIDDQPTAPTQPTAGFTYTPSTKLVAPVTVAFTNTSANASSYKWDFGDGTTATAANPTKQYTNDGSYTVKLTATGTGGSSETSQTLVVGKAAAVDPVGKAVFWATGAWDYVSIETEGVVYNKQPGDAGYVSFPGGQIEKLFTSSPVCGVSGAYTTERPAKTYSYKATAYKTGSVKVAERSGTYTVAANTCTAVKIDFPDAQTTGRVVFWTTQSSGWSTIDVTLSGTTVGSLTTYSSSAPSCGANGSLTVTRPPGTYTFTAKSNTGVTWTDNITITANNCLQYKLNFPTTTACDWAAWSKLISVTKWQYTAGNAYCQVNTGYNGISDIAVKNLASTGMDIYFSLKKPDGTWDNQGFKSTGAGGLAESWICGKSPGYMIYARPYSVSGNTCPFPKQ